MSISVNNPNWSFILVAALALFTSACANQVAPTGGEKDTTPPSLLRAIPESEVTNFESRQIVLLFDEFIQFSYPNDEFSVVPEPPGDVKVRVKPKAIYLTIPDSLAPNTTYIINFGSSVKDLNEGNPLNNLLYVFSTGLFIDSLGIEGTVVNALTNKPEKNFTVGLWAIHDDPTSVKPIYYTKTGENGRFIQSFLRADTFAVYAFNDKNGNRLIDPGSEEVAFLNRAIVTIDSTPNIQLYTSQSYPKTLITTDRKKLRDGHYRFILNHEPNSPLSIASKPTLVHQLLQNRDTVDLFYPPSTDTIHVVLISSDTIAEYIVVPWQLEDSLFIPTLQRAFQPAVWDYKPLFRFIGLMPLSLDSACINLKLIPADSAISGIGKEAQLVNIQEETLLLDLSNIPPGKYYYTLQKGCFRDMAGRVSALIIDSITVIGAESYGELTLNIQMHPQVEPIRLLIGQEKPDPTYSVPVAKNLHFSRIMPGTYTLQFFIDENRNGKWDRANFFQRTQPENLVVFNQVITIRAGWKTEAQVDLMKMFPGN